MTTSAESPGAPAPGSAPGVDIVALVGRVLGAHGGSLRLSALELRALVAFVLVADGFELDDRHGIQVRPAPEFVATRSRAGGDSQRLLVAMDTGPVGFPVGTDLEDVMSLHLTAKSRRAHGAIFVSVRGFQQDARGLATQHDNLELMDLGQLRERVRRAAIVAKDCARQLASALEQLGFRGSERTQVAWRDALLELETVAACPISVEEQKSAVLAAMTETPNSTHRYGRGRPVIAIRHGGKQHVAVGNELYSSEDWFTFHDFLLDFIKDALGRSWGRDEQSKPLSDRHIIMQWNTAVGAFMRANASGGRTNEAVPNGPTRAFHLLAYDLYLLAHHAALSTSLVERLKHPGNFQGARYELAVAATFIRAGFQLTFEDETDRSTKHHEFKATHVQSGEAFAVEAKSRHRTEALGYRGAPQSEGGARRALRRLLRDAAEKPTGLPKIVFLELNAPSMTEGEAGAHLFATLRKVLASFDKRETDSPWNLAVVTNTPHHYGAADETYPMEQSLIHLPSRPRAPLRSPLPLTNLAEAVRNVGQVPRELPPQTGNA